MQRKTDKRVRPSIAESCSVCTSYEGFQLENLRSTQYDSTIVRTVYSVLWGTALESLHDRLRGLAVWVWFIMFGKIGTFSKEGISENIPLEKGPLKTGTNCLQKC